MRKSALILLTLITFATSAVSGQTCQLRCDPNRGKEPLADSVALDANTCEALGQSKTRFPLDTQIQLSIVNQNPFKYTYEYEIREREIESSILKDALGLLNLIPGPGDGDDDDDDDDDDAGMEVLANAADAAPRDMSACTTLSDELDKAVQERKQLFRDIEKIHKESKQLIESLPSEAERIDTSVKNLLNTIPNDASDCQELCAGGKRTLDMLEPFVKKLAQLKTQMAELSSKIEKLKNLSKALNEALKAKRSLMDSSQASACQSEINSFEKFVGKYLDKAIKPNYDKLQEDVEALADVETEAKKMLALLESVETADDAFSFTTFLPARDIPVEHDVTVKRTNRESEAKKSCTTTIRAGRNRFSMSAGIGVSFVEQQTFGRQPSIVPTSMMQDDGTTVEGMGLGAIFAVTEESSESLVGVFQLNGRIGSLGKKSSWGWALGATVGDGEGEASSFGYFTGPTFAFIGDQLFFTLAYHQREVDTLGGGFEVGEPIPSTFMDDPPITTETKGGLLFTVTYRFR